MVYIIHGQALLLPSYYCQGDRYALEWGQDTPVFAHYSASPKHYCLTDDYFIYLFPSLRSGLIII